MLCDPIRPEIAGLEASGISKVAAGAQHDPAVTPLWFGESDLVTPAFIRDAAKTALDEGQTFYSSSRGTPAFRAAIQAYHQRIYGEKIDDQRIIVPGSTMLAVALAAQFLVGRGDEAILIGPYWPNIRTVIESQGALPVDVRLVERPGGWSLDLDAVADAITPRTKAIYVNSPSNPTGWIMSAAEQQSLLDLTRRHGLGLIADEVYHRNVFSGRNPAPSFLELIDENEPVFVVNGCSKAWAMTGWRVGWLIGPSRLAEPLSVMAECSNTGSTVFAQAGGIAALNQGEDFIVEFNARCRQNRDIVMSKLASHPRVQMAEPQGAFYAFPKIDGLNGDSLAFALAVLKSSKLGMAAGYTFGIGNVDHIRLCFAIAPERIVSAMDRLVECLDRPA